MNEIRNNVSRGIQRNAEVGIDIQAIIEGLRNGDAGPAVNALQGFLNQRMGAALKVDGKFGPKTEAAVKAFQGACGLPQTGRIDAGTLAAITGREAPAATGGTNAGAPTGAATDARSAPSSEAQAASRTKTKTTEELMRARMGGALAAQAAGESFEVVSDADVNTAHAELGNLVTQTQQQRQQVSQMRAQVQGEIRALEGKANRGEADNMLLEGKRAQEGVLGQLEGQLDLKIQGFEAARAAVGDGIVTERESAGLQQFSEIVQQKDQVLTNMADNADRMVQLAEQAGAAVPANARPTATPAANGTATTTNAPGAAAPTTNAQPAAPRVGAEQVRRELTDVRAQITERRADLDILKSAPPRDPAALRRHQAEVGLAEQELKLLQKRAADLSKADEALQRGPLSDADAQALQTSKEQLQTQQNTLQAGRAAFDSVGKLKAKMEKDAGSVEAFVQNRRDAFEDASGALERAKARGNPDAIRAATAQLEKARAELGVATRSATLVETTMSALSDGNINAAEQRTLTGMQRAIDESKSRAAAMERRLPGLEEKKQVGSDLRDRVFSWFTSSAETQRSLTNYGSAVLAA